MIKRLWIFFALTFVFTIFVPVFAEEDEKLAFASYLEETLA